MKTVIIIPTYNEKENIGRIIEALEEVFPTIKNHQMNILVVDDNSPDGTADIVREKQKTYQNLFLITGQKQGLGAAYIRGMQHAMKELGAEVVFEMDADFSHDPKYVPKLLEKIDAGYDLVIGSRLVSGGGSEYGLFRKLNTFVSSFIFGRVVAGLWGIHDVTTGFTAIKVRGILEKIDWEFLKRMSQGYSFQLCLKYLLAEAGARVVEVPIYFPDRKFGISKVGVNKTYFRDVLEFMKNAIIIRIIKTKTFIKFGIVGFSGTIVDYAVLNLFVIFFGYTPTWAKVPAFTTAVINNFIWNNIWTFRRRKTVSPIHQKFLAFAVVSIGGLIISVGLFRILTGSFGNQYYNLYNLVVIPVVMFWNFFINNWWTWKERSPEEIGASSLADKSERA